MLRGCRKCFRRNDECVIVAMCVSVFISSVFILVANNSNSDVIKINDVIKGYYRGAMMTYNDSLGNSSYNSALAKKTTEKTESYDPTAWKKDVASCKHGDNDAIRTRIHDGENPASKPDSDMRPFDLNEETSLALEAVMADMRKDKNSTHEVNMTSLVNSDNPEVSFPPFFEFARPGYYGEKGSGVNFTGMGLTREEWQRKKKEFYINNFDVWASRLIPIHRSLFEARSPRCLAQKYHLTNTPNVSVVIVFHNEAWTTLLRSIHSVMDASPKGAIAEIVLLDDFSTHDHLKAPLEWYLYRSHRLKHVVRLIRSTERLGLIKARNVGFLHSKGEIVVFLDSHVECFKGWFEPLIAPILLNPNTVTYPTIDIISTRSFKVTPIQFLHIGSLDINTLAFAWRDGNELNTTMLYQRSPTMPGGLYAVSRKWFHHLGGYDPGLNVWGGENIEFSFKTWMCGGSILLSTCSHIAHVFRSSLPFADTSLQAKMKTNRRRVAEVWMDDFKHYYYEKLAYNLPDPGDLTNQKRLRHSLQCHDFRWYLDDVNPILKKEMDVKGVYSGLITNQGSGLCLQADNGAPTLETCNLKHPKQIWQFTSHSNSLVNLNKHLAVVVEKGRGRKRHRRKNNNVLSTPETTTFRLIMPLTLVAGTRYSFAFQYQQNQRIVHEDSDLCLTQGQNSTSVSLSPCGNNATTQIWTMQTRKEYRSQHDILLS